MGFPVPSVLRAFRTVVRAATNIVSCFSSDPNPTSAAGGELQIVSQLAGDGADVRLGWLPSAMVPDYDTHLEEGRQQARKIGDSRQCTIWVPYELLQQAFLGGGAETVPDLLPGFDTDVVGSFIRRVADLLDHRGSAGELVEHLEHGLGAHGAANMHRVGRTWTKRLHSALKAAAAEAGDSQREMDFRSSSACTG